MTAKQLPATTVCQLRNGISDWASGRWSMSVLSFILRTASFGNAASTQTGSWRSWSNLHLGKYGNHNDSSIYDGSRNTMIATTARLSQSLRNRYAAVAPKRCLFNLDLDLCLIKQIRLNSKCPSTIRN